MHIAIAGAGIVGLQTAWHLRTRGHRVTVLDPEPGGGATFAAAGMLAPVSEVQFGQERLYPLLVAAREEYPRFVDELAQATERPVGFLDNGTLLIGGDRADLERVRDHARVHAEYGLNIQKLSTEEIRRREPFLNSRIAGGFAAPDDAQVDPRVLCAALRDALSAELNPRDFPDAGPPATWVADRVTGVDGDPAGPYTVTTEGGERVTAERVVVACGMGCDAIAGLPRKTPLNIRPVYGDVLRLRPHPSSTSGPLLTSTIRATVLGRQVYLVPRADGEIVVGASVREDGLNGVNAGAVHELLEDALTILPAIRELEIVDVTARARPASPDDIPLLGLLPEAPGILVSAGYSRHGILLSPLGARLGAELLTGRDLSETDRDLLLAMDLERGAPHPAPPAETHRREGASNGNSDR